MKRGPKPKYKPEWAEQLPEMMSKGESVCLVCKKWGISKKSFYNYRDEYPEFAEAYELAQTYGQAWWEETGRQGLWDKTFTDFDEDGKKVKTTTIHLNDRVWARNMCARFKDWQEQRGEIDDRLIEALDRVLKGVRGELLK